MSGNSIRLGNSSLPLNRTAFALIIFTLVLLIIIESENLLISAFFADFSLIISIQNFEKIIFYVFTAVSIITGIFLIGASSRSEIERKRTFLVGSFLLVLSFFPLLFQFLAFPSATSGSWTTIRISRPFVILYFIALLLTFKLGIFFVGFSSFRGPKKILVSAGFAFCATAAAIISYLSYDAGIGAVRFTTALPAAFVSYGRLPLLYKVSQPLEIISIVMFLAAFTISLPIKNDRQT